MTSMLASIDPLRNRTPGFLRVALVAFVTLLAIASLLLLAWLALATHWVGWSSPKPLVPAAQANSVGSAIAAPVHAAAMVAGWPAVVTTAPIILRGHVILQSRPAPPNPAWNT